MKFLFSQIIFEHIDSFCQRVNDVIDHIRTLKDYQGLLKSSMGLKRPKKEDVGISDDDELSQNSGQTAAYNKSQQLDDSLTPAVYSSENTELFSASKVILDTLVEESEETLQNEAKKNYFLDQGQEPEKTALNQEKTFDMKGSYEPENKRLDKDVANSNRKMLESTQKLFTTEKKTEHETKNLLKTATQHLSKEDVRLMQKYYGRSEGPSISSIIESYLSHMKKIVKSIDASQVMDLENKETNEYFFLNFSCNVKSIF